MAIEEYTSNLGIIGREEVNDLEAILSVTNTDPNETVHTVKDNAAALFTWDYAKGARPALNKLYEKAKRSQWNAETDLPWDTEVDLEKNAQLQRDMFPREQDFTGSPFEKFSEQDWTELSIESDNWVLSQFLHGEQGALACTAKIVETVPWIDAKYYAATQVMDEARHVEVFGKYLQEKHHGHYPINAHLKMLLDDIINDSRWDMTYLGMQIMVEGLALAAFGYMREMTPDPLLSELLRYVMADEARHVAFGVLSLKEHYEGLTTAELRDRQEFAFEAAVRMRDRFMQQEVWERFGVKPKEVLPFIQRDEGRALFQQMLFSKIVPNCRKLGLLDAGDGWLRDRFTEMGVIEFEHMEDTGEEYASLQVDQTAASAAEA